MKPLTIEELKALVYLKRVKLLVFTFQKYQIAVMGNETQQKGLNGGL